MKVISGDLELYEVIQEWPVFGKLFETVKRDVQKLTVATQTNCALLCEVYVATNTNEDVFATKLRIIINIHVKKLRFLLHIAGNFGISMFDWVVLYYHIMVNKSFSKTPVFTSFSAMSLRGSVVQCLGRWTRDQSSWIVNKKLQKPNIIMNKYISAA